MSDDRNATRFPEDFMFRLSAEEYISLMSQVETSKPGRGKIRTELGLSQKEVAHRLRITYQSYQAWENPKVANPTLKQLSKLADAVGKKLIIEMA